MSLEKRLDALIRDQVEAQERHRDLLRSIPGYDAEEAARQAGKTSDSPLPRLAALAKLAETGALAELTRVGDLRQAAAEIPWVSEALNAVRTDLFLELTQSRVLTRVGDLTHLRRLSESGVLATLRSQAGTLQHLTEIPQTAELAETADLAEAVGEDAAPRAAVPWDAAGGSPASEARPGLLRRFLNWLFG